ncbi:MAG TPA: LysM peptidoglycan-binding domain-containing protein [Pyrinomonadaceae bacterium]|nr:LysM peptidoglycan-binding domain-containing protein [Pyrinomonadaceae bacterium]
MGENVTVFGDVADRFDSLVAYDEKLLDGYVEGEGYSVKSMVFASTAMAFMTFAKGFVDVGRLGNGILIEGGVKGVGKDALRALTLVGGAGAVISRGTKLLRIVQAGNTCVPVAQTNALRLAGQRFLITVEELAKKSGINLPAIAAAGRQSDTYTKMMAAMQAMKIPFKVLAQGAKLKVADVINLIKGNGGGVITFSIRTASGAMPHRLFATFGRLGGLIIRDPNSRLTIYRSLAELEKVWGAGAVVSDSPIIFIPNSLITTVANAAQTVGGWAGLGDVAMQVVPVVSVPASDEETALQTLMIREKLASANGQSTNVVPSITLNYNGVPGKYHTVVPGDWLSKIAQHYYGDMKKWPVIFAANHKTIGQDPNLIKPGQRLFIPDLPLAHIIAANSLPTRSLAMAA